MRHLMILAGAAVGLALCAPAHAQDNNQPAPAPMTAPDTAPMPMKHHHVHHHRHHYVRHHHMAMPTAGSSVSINPGLAADKQHQAGQSSGK